MSVSITRRSMIAGCLAGLMAYGLGSASPLEAMAAQDTSATDDPKVSGGKGVPATNVAAVESYALLPEGAVILQLQNGGPDGLRVQSVAGETEAVFPGPPAHRQRSRGQDGRPGQNRLEIFHNFG